MTPWVSLALPRCCCSVAQSCLTLYDPRDVAHQASLSFIISWSSLKLMSIESVMPSNHLDLCHPLLLLPSIFPSIRVFSNESVLHIKWPKYWSFSFSISPSSEYSGLISFRINWLDLLAVQGSLKSLLQHHSLKASILWYLAFFMVQLSHPYLTTGKTIALTRRNFVQKDKQIWFQSFFVFFFEIILVEIEVVMWNLTISKVTWKVTWFNISVLQSWTGTFNNV